MRAHGITRETGDHVVSFYESESELAGTVGSYLAGALAAGGQGLVIATPSHAAAFAAELALAGVDAYAARRDGSLLVLDAASTLESFMTADGTVDVLAFDRVVGGAVRDAVATGRPVTAYGEMVALLWEAGNIAAAIELEAVWNELSSRLPFALLCTYPHAAVSGSEHAEALAQVCHLHSSVLEAPAPEASCGFDANVAAPGAARRWTLESLRNFGGHERSANDAALIVTELATNAVLHARSPFSVLLRSERSLLHVSVEDRAPVGPMISASDPLAESGRGLQLISAVSTRCGVEALADGGKRVWAELRR